MSWFSLVKASAESCLRQTYSDSYRAWLPVCFGLFALIATPVAGAQIEGDASGKVLLQNLPIAFEPNVGQAATGESYIARSGALQLGFLSGKVEMHVPSKRGSNVLAMRLLGSDRNAQMTPESKTEGESNYFLGNDPAKWRSHVPQYNRLNYSEIYPGIDLTFYGNGGRLEHDFVVRPGADYRQIRMQYRGALGISLTAQGDLSIKTDDGEVLVHAPYIYQKANGETRQIRGGFVLRGRNEAGFKIESFDRSLPLVIDPVVDYSTFLANVNLYVNGAAVDAAGNTYIVGQSFSAAYPVTAGVFQSGCPACTSNPDLFITKLNSTGTGQVYSTFLGGSLYQSATGIALDSNGNVIVTGSTSSTDFPMKNPISSGVASYNDGFITSLSADGSSLNFSSRLGGTSAAGTSASTYPGAVAVDASGNVYVAGLTESSFLPITPGTLNAGTPSYQNGYFVFLLKLTPAGAQTYGAILGASGSASLCCSVAGMTVDANQNVYLAGTVGVETFTNNTLWPTTAGAYQTQMISPGQTAPFLAEVSSDASKFIYSTLATTGELYGVTWNSKYEAILVGVANYNFPLTADAFGTHTGTSFMVKMSADGTQLLYSSYFSSATADTGGAIYKVALDASENVWLAGNTLPYTSSNIPLVNPLISRPGNTSGFVTEFDPAIHNILFSTYLNGPSGAHIAGLGIDGLGHAHVAGYAPNDFPTTSGAFLSVVGPPPANTSPTYGFAAVIDPTTPGPSICSSGGTAPRTQVGSTGQGSFNLTNCGNAALEIRSVETTGGPVFAALSPNACVGSLAIGASCNFGFTFTPTVAGAAGANFTVTSNAPFSLFTVPISGTGTIPIITLISTSVTFPTQVFGDSATGLPGAVLVINRGTAPLVINLTESTISDPFTIGLNSCNNPVAAGSSCSIRLNFVPTAAGTSVGTFAIASNDPVNPTVSVTLSGTALATYPQPTISGLNPSAIALGSAAQNITIRGANFFPTSTIVVAGETIPSITVGSASLSFTLDPSLLTTVGEIPITLINPSPGGASNSFPLTVYRTVPVSAASLIYNTANQLLYASIPSSSSTNPNTVVSIDPATGNIGTPIPVGNNPGKLAVSSDGAYLYLGSNGDHTLQRINLSTSQVDRTFPLPTDSLTGTTTVLNMQGVPGSPTSVVAGLSRPASPGEAGAVLYNDAGQVSFLGNTFQTHNYGIDSFTFTSDPSVFYAYPFNSAFFGITGVSASGLTVVTQPGGGCCNQTTGSIVASDGSLLYTNSGQVWNPSTQALLGTYSNSPTLFYETSVVPDTPNGRTYFLDSSGGSGPTILSFDQGSYTKAASLSVSGTNSFGAVDLARWGVDGFAFRVYAGTSADQVVILRSSLAHTTAGGVPTLASLSPSSITIGAPNTQMTVNGTGFVPGALVLWNGVALETTYKSSTQLSALIPSNQFVAVGSAEVSVANPSSGGVSAVLTFTITTITLPAPSLAFAAIPNRTFGDQPFTVSATSNSTGAISYSIQSGPASISGSTVTIAGAGTVVVAASQAATTDFNATTVTASFEVAKAQPVISWAAPAAIIYGTALSSVQLNATSSTAGSLLYSPPAGTILNAGSSTLSVTLTPSDSQNYATASANVTILVNKASPAVTLGSSSNPVFFSNSVTFTAAVSAGTGLLVAPPSGSVTFFDGSAQIGTAALANGTATFAISTLSAGSHSISTAYSGDNNFTGTTSAAISQVVENFTIAPPSGASSSVTTQPGGQATYTLAFAPPSGQTFPAAINLAITGMPPGATATFSPVSIPAGAGATTVTLTISVPANAELSYPPRPFIGGPLPVYLGFVFLPFAVFKRKHLLERTRWLLVFLVIATVSMVGLSSCGGKGGASQSSASPRVYTMTLTATSGSLSNSSTLTLTVQ